MPRFQIAGTKRNTLPAFESKALEQGGDAGYNKAGRGYLSKIVKGVQEALKDVPDDANLSIAGDVSTTGGRLSIQLEIYANHPDLESIGVRYAEPEVHQPAGVGARANETVGDDDAETIKSNPSPTSGDAADDRESTGNAGAPASFGPDGTAPSLTTDTSKSVGGASSSGGIGEFVGKDQ